MSQPVAVHLPCPLDTSCADPVRVLVQDGKVVWTPSKHYGACGRPFLGTEKWALEPGAILDPRD